MAWWLLLWLVLPALTFAVVLRLIPGAESSPRRSAAREQRRARVAGALDRVARSFTGGRQDARTFAWELLADEALTEEVWGTAERGYSRNTAVRDASALRVMLTIRMSWSPASALAWVIAERDVPPMPSRLKTT